MTGPKRPKASGAVIVGDFKRGAEAIRDVILAPMLEPLFPNMSDPTVNGSLRLTAQHLIDNPDLIHTEAWKPALIEILRQFVADHPRRQLDNAAIAGAVDQVLLLGGAKTIANQDDPVVDDKVLARARDKVAEALGVEFGTVKKAHLRYGKYKAKRRQRRL
jgi:hypothetical protein